VAIIDTPKVMTDGNWRLGMYVDDEGSDEQFDKLVQVFGGQLGGPMAAIAPLVGEVVGAERAAIEICDDGLLHSVRVGDAIDFEVEDIVPFGDRSGRRCRRCSSPPATSAPGPRSDCSPPRSRLPSPPFRATCSPGTRPAGGSPASRPGDHERHLDGGDRRAHRAGHDRPVAPGRTRCHRSNTPSHRRGVRDRMPITADDGVSSESGAAMSLEEDLPEDLEDDRAAADRAARPSAPGRTGR
jgi:hypothetical protein